MAGLGLIVTGAALLNYRKAKSEYDSLVEQRDGLMAVIDSYNQHRLDPYVDSIDTQDTQFPQGLQYSTLLRVANLVGQIMRVHTSVIMTNTNDKPIILHRIAADCSLYGEELTVINYSTKAAVPQEVVKLIELQPGETLEVQLPKGVAAPSVIGRLRDDICAACGKKLITSCWKVNLDGIEAAKIRIDWSWKEDTTAIKAGIVNNKPGVLRYCGEAGLN